MFVKACNLGVEEADEPRHGLQASSLCACRVPVAQLLMQTVVAARDSSKQHLILVLALHSTTLFFFATVLTGPHCLGVLGMYIDRFNKKKGILYRILNSSDH